MILFLKAVMGMALLIDFFSPVIGDDRKWQRRASSSEEKSKLDDSTVGFFFVTFTLRLQDSSGSEEMALIIGLENNWTTIVLGFFWNIYLKIARQ